MNNFIIEKGEFIFYVTTVTVIALLLFINSHLVVPLLIICLFLPILNKNNFSFIEFLFVISLLLIYFRFILLSYFDFSFVYINFFPLDKEILYHSTILSLTYIVIFSYIIYFYNKIKITSKLFLTTRINTTKVNYLLTCMLLIKLVIFFYVSIKMGQPTSILQKIIDMLIANLFLIDLLFLITFITKDVFKINILLFILISIITTSKAAIFMLFLLYFISISSTMKYYKIFSLKYLIYLVLGLLFFIIFGTISNAVRTGGDINFIFSTIDPILGLFRRLGIIDNIVAIQTMDVSKVEYFSIYNLFIQFVLGFIPNSLFDLDYYGVSIGWAVAHYGLGQADTIINAYETSSIGTALLFSHNSIILTLVNILLLYMPILIVYYFTKDIVIRYYALFMFIIITLTGDVRIDALLIKHIIIYKLIILPLITYKKRKTI